MNSNSRLALVAAAILASCSSPVPPDSGVVSCANGLACPAGLECAWDENCYAPGKAPANPKLDLSVGQLPDLTPACTPTSCSAPTPICDPNSGECVACVDDTNCPNGKLCQNEKCVPGCSMEHGCGDAGTCNGDSGQCGGCSVDGDCGDPKNPRCSPTGLCVPCLPTNDNCAPSTFCAILNGAYACSMGCKIDMDCQSMNGRDAGPPMALACCNHVCADVGSDPANCGKCANACANNGACCAAACTNTTNDVKNCGGCGKACAGQNANWSCAASQCAIAGCIGSYQDCNKSPVDGCEANTATDPLNCLGCGNICSVINGVPACNNGCAIQSCNPNFANCDQSYVDGCNINVQTDLHNCGFCQNACIAAPHATAACNGGFCGVGSCAMGYGDCDKLPGNGCESTLASDVANCGACGNACPKIANGVAGCVMGICGASSCNNGFKHCSMNPADGCEANLASDPKNCGACGNVCPAAPNALPGCANGACGIGSCVGAFKDCNGNPLDGCEVNSGSDANNCGGCGAICPGVDHGSPGCANGLCGVGVCAMGYANCNNNPAGCETNTQTDNSNCGACGMACANGLTCQGGVCSNLPQCIRVGWKTGNANWACPANYRMPTVNEYNVVAPCIQPGDVAMFGYYNDIAVDVGGCNCKWNGNWCGQPSIDTIRQGRACGDYQQLQICLTP